MGHHRKSAISIFSAAVLIAVFAWPGHSDLLTTTDDQLIDGTFVGYRNDAFRFEADGQVTEYPADQVRSITISARQAASAPETGADQVMLQQMSQSLAALHQRMDALQYQIEQMAASQNTRLSNIQQRTYDLSPVSRMAIEGQTSGFERSGDFVVEGFIRNYSGVMVFNPEVSIELVGASGEAVFSEVVEANVSSVGPNSRARFRAVIKNPPKFDVYYVTPVLTHREDPGMEPEMDPYFLYNPQGDR